MTLGLAYWIIYLLFVILGAYTHRAVFAGGDPWPFGGGLILALLLFLLGWGVFGFIVKG